MSMLLPYPKDQEQLGSNSYFEEKWIRSCKTSKIMLTTMIVYICNAFQVFPLLNEAHTMLKSPILVQKVDVDKSDPP